MMRTGCALCVDLVLFWRRLLSRLQLLAILASVCRDRSRKLLALGKKQAAFSVEICWDLWLQVHLPRQRGGEGHSARQRHPNNSLGDMSLYIRSQSIPEVEQQWVLCVELTGQWCVFFSVVCGYMCSILLMAGSGDKERGQPWPGVPCSLRWHGASHKGHYIQL